MPQHEQYINMKNDKFNVMRIIKVIQPTAIVLTKIVRPYINNNNKYENNKYIYNKILLPYH